MAIPSRVASADRRCSAARCSAASDSAEDVAQARVPFAAAAASSCDDAAALPRLGAGGIQLLAPPGSELAVFAIGAKDGPMVVAEQIAEQVRVILPKARPTAKRSARAKSSGANVVLPAVDRLAASRSPGATSSPLSMRRPTAVRRPSGLTKLRRSRSDRP